MLDSGRVNLCSPSPLVCPLCAARTSWDGWPVHVATMRGGQADAQEDEEEEEEELPGPQPFIIGLTCLAC